jgi:hypothetical protein
MHTSSDMHHAAPPILLGLQPEVAEEVWISEQATLSIVILARQF